MAKIVAYSKTAEYAGQEGYLLWEAVDQFHAECHSGLLPPDPPKLIHWKTPIPAFLKQALK